jgi:oxygen-dependent protoporphyrinogen oxidase
LTEGRVLVAGAGLAGLALAVRLLAAGRDVRVLEADGRAGGQIETLVEDELVVELGAEGFVARSRAVPDLCALLGLESALVDQLTTDTFAVEGGSFVLLPPGEAARRLGFQVPDEELGRGIRSLERGMGQLIEALLARLGSERVRTAAAVTALRRVTSGLELELADGQRMLADDIVLATPARLAAPLLEPLGAVDTDALVGARTMSNVSVNLLYRRAQLRDLPAGSGLLFPESFADRGLRAATFVNHKFARRAPADCALLRVFFRPSAAALSEWSDQRFASEAASAIAQVLEVSGGPERHWVSRWVDALPVFSPVYRQQVAALDDALGGMGVHLTGSAFHGAGIDAAVASAERVAARLLA